MRVQDDERGAVAAWGGIAPDATVTVDPRELEAEMDHAGFKAWLDRYVDAWRLNDPLAIGDLFSADVRYAYDPFEEAVVGPHRRSSPRG